LSDSTIIHQPDCVFSSIKPELPRTLHRNSKALYWLFLGLTSGGLFGASRRFFFSVIRRAAIKNDSSAILQSGPVG
jgi:hypothetical protein